MKSPNKEVVAYVVLSVVIFDKENKVSCLHPLSTHTTQETNDLSWKYLSMVNIRPD